MVITIRYSQEEKEQDMWHPMSMFVSDDGCHDTLFHYPWSICVLGSKLPRGWSSTQVRRGLYTHYKDSRIPVIKGGMTIPYIATFDHSICWRSTQGRKSHRSNQNKGPHLGSRCFFSCDPNVGFVVIGKVRNHDHTIHVNMYIYTSTFQSGCQLNPKRCWIDTL